MPPLRTLIRPPAGALCAFLLLAGFGPAPAADHPSYARVETITEYDVDLGWPKRPGHVKPFGWVSGIAIDAQGDVWVFTKGEDPVQVYASDGRFVRTWGRGQFVEPHHLRIDPEGNVWVADFGLHVVQKYTPEGRLLLTLGTRGQPGEDATHFNRPTDVAVTKAGDLFVTDGYGNRRVVHFDRNGKFVKAWGSYGSKPGQFILPHAIVADDRGRLYVADRNSARIQVFDQEGRLLDQWSNVVMPWGLGLARNGDLWVCGSSPHWWYRDGKFPEIKDQMFVRFSPEGKVRQVWTIPLGVKGKLKPGEAIGVHCIAEDAKGNLYVGDIYGERAQKFVPVSRRLPAAKIVTLGDSITRGVRQGVTAKEAFAALLEAELRKDNPEVTVVNVGIGGERTDQALRRLERDVLALKPAVVTVMYGTNDSYVDAGARDARISPAEYRANLEALVERLRQAGVAPVLMTEPRWGDAAKPNGAGEHPNLRLEKYVAACREVAWAKEVPLVDHFRVWSDAAKGTDIGRWTTDQCHPNPQGHRVMADAILPVVKQVLRSLPEKKP
jgi:lysophospholipase L1-like esterase/sugar lactone lactonase YvrE